MNSGSRVPQPYLILWGSGVALSCSLEGEVLAEELHGLFAGQASPRDMVLLAIRGDPARGAVSIGRKLERFAGWMDGGAAVIRFEDLIGAAGGGDDGRQLGALRTIYDHLGLAADAHTLERIRSQLTCS